MSTPLFFISALSVIGIFNTLYLSYHALTKTPVACVFFPPEWCQKVQFSKWSKTAGIPNPFLGLLMYVVLLILCILFAQERISSAPISVVVSIGFAFSFYFTVIQAFVLRAFCTWCVLSALEFTALFILIWFL